jgi:hypothetical protein
LNFYKLLKIEALNMFKSGREELSQGVGGASHASLVVFNHPNFELAVWQQDALVQKNASRLPLNFRYLDRLPNEKTT